MGVVKILIKSLAAAAACIMMFGTAASAYDAGNLPESMTFAEALSISNASEITSATICDTDENIYKNLNADEIAYFYRNAKDIKVWRKTNPTPFRGTCVNFVTSTGARISYYYNSGIQIGKYGDGNYVCYMPAASDTNDLRYLESEFFDSKNEAYGGNQRTASTTKDFLKLPEADWAKTEIKAAAAKNLVPYEFTDKYTKPITREEMAILIANWIVAAGNYANMDAYMTATGTAYLRGNFIDCKWRDENIDQLYALGIVHGKTDYEFDPDGYITRQEAAALITRAADLYMYIGTNYKGKPSDKIADWAQFHVRWCMDKGIMTCDDSNRFYPEDNMTVQQAITVLSRLYDIATYWES